MDAMPKLMCAVCFLRKSGDRCSFCDAVTANAAMPPVTSGATDYRECPQYAARRRCRCGACAVCGHPKHSAPHGACCGQPPGSEPWGHQFVPADPEVL